MINVQLYNHSSCLLPYLKEQFVHAKQVTIITPNPALADIARTRFFAVHGNVQTITIAKFLKDELMELIAGEQLENFKGKSNLNLLLGSLWKIKKNKSSYELFKRCFQILTDFRSFTLNDDILETILENYDQELATGVLWFHKVLSQMDCIDEHRSYFLLSERLRNGDLPPTYQSNKTILFWGFDFLTGSQVDLLNALAIRNDVNIPFSALAYEHSKDLDWIKWLTKFEANIVSLDDALLDQVDLKTISFPKNYLGTSLKRYKDNFLKNKPLDIVLGTKGLTDDHAIEIPFASYSYKIGVDLFVEKLSLLEELLTDQIRQQPQINHSKIIETAQFFAKEAVDKQDFRAIKAATVFIETVNEWVSLSEHNETLSSFDLKIIFDSARLDLPRNSIFSSGKNESLVLRSLKNIEQKIKSDQSAFCITSSFDGIKQSSSIYSESVEKYLASIGPVRRGEFEFLILKSKIIEHLRDEKSILFVEDGITEHDLGWSNILSSFNLVPVQIDVTSKNQRAYQVALMESSYELNSMSASKLQTYLDCPRKFYLSYVLKQRPRIELTQQLNYMQLGLIEHAVIEKYLKTNSDFEQQLLDDQILEVLNDFESQGRLLPEKKEEYWLEVKALCTEVIKELIELNKLIGIKLNFEYKLPGNDQIEINGSIDCYGQGQFHNVIFDFKRGAGSIPSLSGLKEFTKIQLWFYLDKLKDSEIKLGVKKLLWGYINLSSLEDSLIFCDDEVTIELLKGSGLKMFKKLYLFDEKMKELVQEYNKFELKKIKEIQDETRFPCRPKEVKVCQYCELANICPRKEIESLDVIGQ